MIKLRFDIYESNLDGSEEKKLLKDEVYKILSFQERQVMTDIHNPQFIEKNNKQYWAEEAMDYGRASIY